MDYKLKRCPFCGCRAELISGVDRDGDKVYGVRCVNFSCIGSDIEAKYGNTISAIKTWNRRVSNGVYQD